VEGMVATQHGTIPLGGVQVEIRTADDRPFGSVLTDGDGRFRVAEMPPGKYRVVVALDGFMPATDVVAVAGGRTHQLTFDLALAGVTATVDVVASATLVSSADTLTRSDSVASKETDRYASGGGLQAALRLLASVIEVPGGVSIKGGRPTQSTV